LVPSDATLYELHAVLQVVMGWADSHLHDFSVGKQRYALPEPGEWDDALDEFATRLIDVVKPRGKIVYQYDFGDSWKHEVRIEKTQDGGVPAPVCMAGARACPPEDCGGPWGYADSLASLADPKADAHEEVAKWFPPYFDPEKFDIAKINAALQKATGGRKRRGHKTR
jgi:hypothetical protein